MGLEKRKWPGAREKGLKYYFLFPSCQSTILFHYLYPENEDRDALSAALAECNWLRLKRPDE